MRFSISFNSLLAVLSLISLPSVNARWKPPAGVKWNWILGENPNKLSVPKGEYEVIDIDLDNVTAETVSKYHNLGLKVICYFSAGTYEPFRGASQEMLKVEGLVMTKMKDWDENWLDFRKEGIKPFMTERMDLAVQKGCDGVEFDNVDAFANTKWPDPLTANDQITFNRWLAQEAHNRNLAAGLKNCVGLLNNLVNDFDFAINESCSSYTECPRYSVFLNQNKPVFTALYGLITDVKFTDKICSQIQNLPLSIIIKDPDQSLKYPYHLFEYHSHCQPKTSTTVTTTTTTVAATSTATVSHTKLHSLPYSYNGKCGPVDGHCPPGQCCGKNGQCGRTSTYCTNGCQPLFGVCHEAV